MKKNYVMPQMKVVKINQRINIMAGTGAGVSSVGGNAGFNYVGGGNYEGRSRDYDDWDEE
jgi:hypothetical protein